MGSDLEDLRQEVRELRAEVCELRQLVRALQQHSTSGIESFFVVGAASSSVGVASPYRTSGSDSGLSCRERGAVEVGRFLRRCLDGERRGSLGRASFAPRSLRW